MKKVFIGIDVGKFKNSISIIDTEGNPIIKKDLVSRMTIMDLLN